MADADRVVVDVVKAAVSEARAVDRIVPRAIARVAVDLRGRQAVHVARNPAMDHVSRGFWFMQMKST